MHSSIKQLNLIKNKVNKIIDEKQLKTKPEIIVVTKTFPLEKILPLLDYGHTHYGENKVQEAEIKWQQIKSKYNKIQLHMVGKLQTNKAKKAVSIFDYIHSLDSDRLATKISLAQQELNKKVNLFIQVDLAGEVQKSGIDKNNLINFYNYCTNDLSLNVVGLMCLPPVDLNSVDFFKMLNDLCKKINLKDLSMGMSSDFEEAVLCGSTYLRLGTLIMGSRKII